MGHCQVYVDAAFADKLPYMSENENDLLDSTESHNERLHPSCQLAFGAKLSGLGARASDA